MVRLNRIRDYTLLCAKNPRIPFTLNNLLSKVDMHGGGLIDAINTYKGIHQHVSPDAMSVLYNPHSMIGLVSPEKIFNEEAFTVPSSPVRIALDKAHHSSTSSSSSSPEHQVFDGFREEEN